MANGAARSQAPEHLLRELAPAVLGALTRSSGDFAAAEDAVQEALLAAHVEWARSGAPANPGGWLYRVARRRLLDQRASDSARRTREMLAGAREEREETVESTTADDEMDATAGDDALRLLFLCCHPALSPASAIPLTLRAVGGLTTAEIARAFLVPEPTMAQRISRAKQRIASSGVAFELPSSADRARRIDDVLHVLYLMFNEGYATSAGEDLLRVDLSSEAIRLARLLRRLEPEHAEASGLLALMLLSDARRGARTGSMGELIPLHEQDRSRWDRELIAEGTALVTAAFAKGAVASYQLQAAIAALHDEAPSFDATDWPQILALYGLLLRICDNPMVALSRAVAAAMVHGPAKGLELVAALDADPRIAGHYRLDAVRGHLLEMTGDVQAAIRHYRAAAARTASTAERSYLTTKAARLAHG